MKRLDTTIKTNGHTYRLFRRSEDVAVYKQYSSDKVLVGFEMFVITKRPKEVILGNKYPEREVYASLSDWGVSAWTLSNKLTEEEVLTRFEDLNNKIENDR